MKIFSFIIYIVVIILQIIMTQVITFLASLFLPNGEQLVLKNQLLFAVFIGVTFSVGVFWVGWLAIRLRWLKLPPKHLARFIGGLVGAYLPLLTSALVFRNLAPGSPFFFIAILGSVLGFYAAGWWNENDQASTAAK